MSETAVRPYPFDLSTLAKGSVIAVEKIEHVGGVKCSDVKKYQLALLRVKELLEKQWLSEYQERITVRQRGDALIICTDDTAVGENIRRSAGHVRGLRRDLARQHDVNRAKLTTTETRDQLDRSLVRLSAFVSSGTRAVRAALKPVERKTPGLSVPK